MKSTKNEKLLLRCRCVVLPDRLLENASVLTQDERILSISSSHEVTGFDRVVELGDATLFPGFIDTHIHGSVAVDTMAATTDDLEKVSRFLATQGVTGWLPTLVPAPHDDYESAIRAIDEAMSRSGSGARVLGVHYEGPFVSSHQCGALRSAYFKSFTSDSDIAALPLPSDANAVRMMTIAPEILGGLELTRELVRRGWIVAIGHTRAPVELLNGAFAAGARHMTHFMNAMPPLHHREPGPVGWGLARNDVSIDVIADGVHLDPLVLQLLLQTKGAEQISLITDAIAAAGQGDGEYRVWGETITVNQGRTSNERGSIAGSVISMREAVRMMRSLGASEVEAARMTSTNPARMLGIADDCGSIEEGKRADLVALEDDGNVKLTIMGGDVVFPHRPGA